MNKTLIIIVHISISQVVNADCWYNGYMYPTGTKIGGLTCQANGSWK